jgi:glycosyltransferase involved in cell wall biosynthesis
MARGYSQKKQAGRSLMRRAVEAMLQAAARVVRVAAWPVNRVLAALLASRVVPNSVLHISYMVHIPYETVQHLRRQGIKAAYLAIGRSSHWNKCDYNFVPSPFAPIRALQELWIFWTLIARYQVVHAHFMYAISESGWELPLLKRMNRKLVAHFRGCEARDRERNMLLHPEVNICQACEHRPYICLTMSAARRRRWARDFADVTLVTTPDMKDFLPEATHFPFFAPDMPEPAPLAAPTSRPFTVVHVTNQPGIEGTTEIEAAIETLRSKGYVIDFRWLRDLSHQEVLDAIVGADLAVGKMKMGYYSNAQIEAMACGIPAVTYVREDFMTDQLRASGFIFSTLPDLARTIAHYIDHRDALEAKRRIARASILKLHDNEELAGRLIAIYASLGQGRAVKGDPLPDRQHGRMLNRTL